MILRELKWLSIKELIAVNVLKIFEILIVFIVINVLVWIEAFTGCPKHLQIKDISLRTSPISTIILEITRLCAER